MTKKTEHRVKIKILKTILNIFMCSLSVIIFAACDNPFLDNVFQPRYVTFNSNGGSHVENQVVLKGDRVIKPADPVKTGNEFAGWFQDKDFKYEWDFYTVPANDIILYAKWDDRGIALSPSGDKDFGTETVGYEALEAYTVTVINLSATQPTSELIIELTGENADCFSLSTTTITNIAPNSRTEFTVVPNADLPIGTYTAAVIITGVNNIFAKFNISFSVFKAVVNMEIIDQPDNLIYTYGQPLDLSGLVVDIEYSDGSSDLKVPHSEFASKNIVTIPASGDIISVLEYNDCPVNIIAGRYTTNTDNLIVNPKPVTISVTAENKVYDGTTAASVRTALINGLLLDDVVLTVQGDAVFANKNAAENITVTFSGFSLDGDDAGNYYLAEEPVSVTADITPRQLTMSNPNVTTTKVYDGTTVAAAVIGALQNLVTGDDVSAVIESANFNSPNVTGTYFVTVVYSISGAGADNYVKPVNYTVSGSITGASPVITAWPSGMTAFFGQFLRDVSIPDNGESNPPGKFSWTIPGSAAVNTGTQSFSMTFTADDSGNYLTQSNFVDVIVEAAPVMSALIFVKAPIAGNVPDTYAYGSGNFYISGVSWEPGHDVFDINDLYTVFVTIKIDDKNYTFKDGLIDVKINDQEAVVEYNDGTTAILSYSFPETGQIFITGIAIKTNPALVYTHGDTLNLNALEISLFYNDDTRDDVMYGNFSTYGDSSESITVSMANNVPLSHLYDNNMHIIVTYTNKSTDVAAAASLYPLTVNPKTINITGVTAVNRVYDGYETVALGGGALQGVVAGNAVNFDLYSGYMSDRNAGNNKPVYTGINLFGADAGNYILNQPSGITVNIAQAPLTIASVYTTKPYDGNNSIQGGIDITLSGIIGMDEVYVNPYDVAATYTTVNVESRTIRINGLQLLGSNAGNYYMGITLPANFSTPNGTGIVKAPGPDAAAPTWNSSSVSGSSITINANTPVTGQTFEYAISNQQYGGNLQWGSGLTFTRYDGKPFTNETYYVFARSSNSNANYNVGEPSLASEPIIFCRVTFINNNGGSLSDRLVLNDNIITGLVIPVNQGYYLEGVYRNSQFTNKWDLTTERVLDDITLYANWTANPKVTVNFNGTALNIVSGHDNTTIYKSGGIGRPTEISFEINNYDSVKPVLWNYDDFSLASSKAIFTLSALNSAVEAGSGKVVELSIYRLTPSEQTLLISLNIAN